VADYLTKESLDLISALRPFTGRRGRNLIDTLVDLAEGDSSGIEGMEIASLAEKASDLLSVKIESAISLFFILVIVWLVQLFTTSQPQEPKPAT